MATIQQPRKQPQTIIIQPGARITAREYAALPNEPGWLTELHQGVVVKMPLIKDLRHDWIVANLIAALHTFVTPRRLGRVSSEQVGYNVTIAGESEDTTYGPDVAFLSAERIPLAQAAIAQGDYAPAPDVVAEVVSASQSKKEVAERAERWLGAGTRLVWNIWPESQTVDVWTPDSPMSTLHLSERLDGLDVLPGFTLALADLFA
ncbi:MAG TPA: Uma2 family endonuclease [Ktedonobacterales bacterium]|nr:Uma2 family endonuclease [Ktedonobacterales bacterium]